MAGKAGRSGRKPGALSWHQNVVARCGHRLNVLIEHWLAGAPERRFTVPPKIMRALALQAIREELDNMIEWEKLVDPAAAAAIDVDAVLAWSRRQAPKGPSLRRKVRGPDPDDPYAQYCARIENAWQAKGVDK
jgi:hypothetical protein